MQIALVPFALGLFFFYLGLDDANDYLRIYHGIWHICASVFGYYCLTSVRVVDHSTK
jgi:predicted membrane channel-forming protein YqfA (hemolysin III family)